MIKLEDGSRISVSLVKNKLEKILKNKFYVLDRYKMKCSVSFIYIPHPNNINFEEMIDENIRDSDELIKIHNELYAVFFDYIDAAGGYKASQKIIYSISTPKIPVIASLIEIEKSETIHSIIQKNLATLQHLEENKNSMIVDCGETPSSCIY